MDNVAAGTFGLLVPTYPQSIEENSRVEWAPRGVSYRYLQYRSVCTSNGASNLRPPMLGPACRLHACPTACPSFFVVVLEAELFWREVQLP
jgi:hypothetical protein